MGGLRRQLPQQRQGGGITTPWIHNSRNFIPNFSHKIFLCQRLDNFISTKSENKKYKNDFLPNRCLR
jgi:hypothetical protein